MFQKKIYEIESCDDVELGIKRANLLEVELSFDDEVPMRGVFCFAPSLGDDNSEDYWNKIAEFVVKEFKVVFIVPKYHCLGNRPQTGAKFYLDEIDKLIATQSAQALGIEIPPHLLGEGELNMQQASDLFSYIDENILWLKRLGKVRKEFHLPLHASLKPPKEEYQNYGIMQAMDCLNAVLDVIAHPPFKLEKDFHTIMMGSSHGGYLAHLAAKIAPWAVDGVLDNSSYANFILRFVGFGKEIDYTTHAEFCAGDMFDHILVYGSSKTFFTSNKSSKNYFSPAHAKMREIYDEEHLKTQANYHKPAFISFHSAYDKIAPAEFKIALYKSLKKLEFDTDFHLIKLESEVDGKFIKTLNHGMNMSLKTLIQRYLPVLLEKPINNDKKDIKETFYDCGTLTYHFKQKARGGGIELELIRNEAAE